MVQEQNPEEVGGAAEKQLYIFTLWYLLVQLEGPAEGCARYAIPN